MPKTEEESMTKCETPYTSIGGVCIYSDINRDIIPFTFQPAGQDQMKVCIQNKDKNGQKIELCSDARYIRKVNDIYYNYNQKRGQFMYYGLKLTKQEIIIGNATSGFMPVLEIGKRTYLS